MVTWGYPSWLPECHLRDLVRIGKFAWQRSLGDVDDLTAASHHVAMACAYFAAVDGTRMFAGEKRIAEFCRRSVRHVRTQLRRLVAAGYLKRLTHGGGRPRRGQKRRYGARYELTLPAHLAPVDSGTRSAPTASESTPARRAPSGDRGAADPARVAAGSISKLRDALGQPDLPIERATEIVQSVLAAAPDHVRRPAAYVLRSVQREPHRWRLTNPIGDRCGIHPQHQAAGCLDCRSAQLASAETIRQARERARRAR